VDEAAASGRDLIVLKNQIVTEAFAALNLNLSQSRPRNFYVDAFGAGKGAGDHVNLSSPLTIAGAAPLALGSV
jgi:hypothetical protein